MMLPRLSLIILTGTILSGCASVPVALSLATVAAAGVGYTVVADESIIDPLVSIGEKMDCNALRMGRDNGPYCRPIAAETKEQSKPSVPNGASASQWCYRTLGGLSCYTEPIPNREPEYLLAYGVGHQEKVVKVGAARPADEDQPIVNSQNDNGQARPSLATGDYLTSPGVVGLAVQGQALRPLPNSAQSSFVPSPAVQKSNQERSNQDPTFGGLQNNLPGASPGDNSRSKRSAQLPGRDAQSSPNQPPSLYVPRSDNVRQDEKLSDNKFAVSPYRKGGLPGPENGVILGEPYADYNPSWIRSFPYSYRQPGQNTTPFLGRVLPGINP